MMIEMDDYDQDDDNVSSICSPSSGESGIACNSSTGNLLLSMALNNNRNEINESSSPLHNDPFLSFSDGLGGLVSDNYLCSLSSSSSSSSRLTSSSPDFTLTSGSIDSNSHLITKRPSSLCDSPPPSSCNSTLTSYLDLCGSFAPEDEDEFDSLGGLSGCGRSDRTIIQRHYDDEFPLLSNDESIWDTFIHSNDINDMINSDELLSSPPAHFPILQTLCSLPSANSKRFKPNYDMSRNEIDRKSDYFTLDSEMKKYRTMADSVYSKPEPSCVQIARKLAYNSSSSSSSSMPSPKRAYLPSKSSVENNYKRMKLPSTLPSMQGTSVLMNLLVNGEDVTNGYCRFQQQSHLKNNSINVNIG